MREDLSTKRKLNFDALELITRPRFEVLHHQIITFYERNITGHNQKLRMLFLSYEEIKEKIVTSFCNHMKFVKISA